MIVVTASYRPISWSGVSLKSAILRTHFGLGSSSGNSNWNGGSGSSLAVSCFEREPFAGRAFDRNRFALHVIDAEFRARVLAEVKFAQIPVEMLGINVLINANNPAFEDRKEPFKSVGMHIAPRPFKLGMVNSAVAGRARVLEHWRAVRDQAALPIKVLVEQAAHPVDLAAGLGGQPDLLRPGFVAEFVVARDQHTRIGAV